VAGGGRIEITGALCAALICQFTSITQTRIGR